MEKFRYSQETTEAIRGVLKGEAVSPTVREALEEGRFQIVEVYLRSGVTNPTQYQDPHEMQALLRTCMNERELAAIGS